MQYYDCTKREIKRWIKVSMIMLDAVDSAEVDMSTTTRKSWYIEAGSAVA